MSSVETSGYDVRVSYTQVDVPHGDGVVTFFHPGTDGGKYGEVVKSLLDRDEVKLSRSGLISLVHALYHGPEGEVFKQQFPVRDMKRSLEEGYVFVPCVNVFTSNGMYAINDVKGEGFFMRPSVTELSRRLRHGRTLDGGVRESSDGLVRFAPLSSYAHTSEPLTPEALRNRGDVLAVYGSVGMQALLDMVRRPGGKSVAISSSKVPRSDLPEVRVCALAVDGPVLELHMNKRHDYVNGCFFGLKKE